MEYFVLRTGDQFDFFDLTRAYGLMKLLYSVYDFNRDKVSKDSLPGVEIQRYPLGYKITVKTKSKPKMDSSKYRSFKAFLIDEEKHSASSFIKKSSVPEYMRDMLSVFSCEETVQMILDKYLLENIGSQLDCAILDKKGLLGTIEPAAIKAQRSDQGILKYVKQVEFPKEDIYLSFIGNTFASRYIRFSNESGETMRIRFLFDPEKIPMGTSGIVLPDYHAPVGCPVAFIKGFVAINAALQIKELGMYSEYRVDSILYSLYKKNNRTYKPYQAIRGMEISNVLTIGNISDRLILDFKRVYDRAYYDYATLKTNTIAINLALKISQLFSRFTDEGLMELVRYLIMNGLRKKYPFEKNDIMEVWILIEGKSKELIEYEQITKFSSALKEKINATGKKDLIDTLSRTAPQEEMELMYFITDHIADTGIITHEDITKLLDLYQRGYNAKDIAKGIVLRYYLS